MALHGGFKSQRLNVNGLAYRGLLDPNCEDDSATLLDNLHSFLKPSSVCSPSQSSSHERETTNDVPYIAHANEAQEGVLSRPAIKLRPATI